MDSLGEEQTIASWSKNAPAIKNNNKIPESKSKEAAPGKARLCGLI